MNLRRPWRVLLWSLLLYASLVVAMYGCVGSAGVLGGSSCIVTVAAGTSPFLAMAILQHIVPHDPMDGAGESAISQILEYVALGFVVLAFVAQTMAAAAVLDAIARRTARVRRAAE